MHLALTPGRAAAHGSLGSRRHPNRKHFLPLGNPRSVLTCLFPTSIVTWDGENKNLPLTLQQWLLLSGAVFIKGERKEEKLGTTEAKEEYNQLYTFILSLAGTHFN